MASCTCTWTILWSVMTSYTISTPSPEPLLLLPHCHSSIHGITIGSDTSCNAEGNMMPKILKPNC
ncbi:hypothetical protein CsSME_00021964 [Camellia sinensis var. sinensis]